MKKNIIFWFLLLKILNISSNNADLIIFSYNRPLQLYAFLESIDIYIKGLNKTFIIYRSSSDEYETAYQEVQRVFPNPTYLSQQSIEDFKKLTIQAMENSQVHYLLFGVDDIIVKDFIVIDQCINLLEKYQAYGFYLRMGTHLTHAYPKSNKQPLPPLKEVEDDVFAWQFSQGASDWGYPNTVDMTLYRKKDIVQLLISLPFNTPNLLEGMWSTKANMVMHKKGLCFNGTKIVNIPLNRVQNNYPNPHMNFLQPVELLTIFNEGKKIDIAPLFQVKNEGSHWDYVPTFIQRVS